MRQLSGLDSSFLRMETPSTYGHVASLAIFDPATAPHPVGYQEVRALIEARLHLVPPFRRRLVEVPLGLDHPYWIEDPDFDLDFPLRHIAVPPPGDRGPRTRDPIPPALFVIACPCPADKPGEGKLSRGARLPSSA